MRRAVPITLTAAERHQLRDWCAGRGPSDATAQRCRIVLMAAEGFRNREIAVRLRVSPPTVSLWRHRFARRGLAAIRESSATGGRRDALSVERVRAVLETTLERERPGGGKWTTRSVAAACGVSRMAVQRIWRMHDVGPRDRTRAALEPPAGPLDVIGCLLHPHERVLAVAAGASGCRRRADALQAHEALRLLRGLERLMARQPPPKQADPLPAFLCAAHRAAGPLRALHLLVEAYATHRRDAVYARLKRAATVRIHFVPSRAPWADAAGGWLHEALLAPAKEAPSPLGALRSALDELSASYLADPRPLAWIAPRPDAAGLHSSNHGRNPT